MSETWLTLGTAGHVDHGKTRLVERLTGTDTDRLAEEKARGISIALGYAQLVLPSGTQLSVVDVPGHERFVRTMVAGATGIDLYLLVVDAREGPRAQTFEHLEILRLLGVETGVAAVTKIDGLPAEQVAEVVAEVRALVPSARVVPVSSVTGEGIEELVIALDEAAAEARPNRVISASRLYVDRVFTVAGAGTVVTGTLWSGELGRGETVEVLPAGFEARIRGLEVHGETVERGVAGRRVAVNLRTLERRDVVARGDALVAVGAYPVSYRLDVVLENADGVAHGSRVEVCHGTSRVSARVVRAGDRWAQLRLDRPVVAARGDRFVLRREGTLGGGRVLDPRPPRRIDPARLALLEDGDPREIVVALAASPVRLQDLRRRAVLDEPALNDALSAVVQSDGWVFAPAWLDETRAASAAALAGREGELDPGLQPAQLLGGASWAAAVIPLLGLELHDGKAYLPGRRATSGDRGESLGERLAQSGLTPVRVDDRELALQLEREGRLVRLGDGLAIEPGAYAQAKAVLLAECERDGVVTLAGFRDALGVSRRVAQLLLERFDSDRLTIRVGEARRLRRGATLSGGAEGPGGPAGLQNQ
ncbi:MAG TPA: selenocysteine-specific translation elongation factor [Gaiellaceae bacterium]|nr:selenocysteine-specific translation elongation factor [Gaiellaceae bacterium]